ncbi:MAG: MotE family protein [Rhodospirillales bacterium]|jgi:flagellar motility protein MotE (MotC chaperone)
MLKFISRIRFLPITICAAVLMLSAKLGSLAGDMDDMMSEFFAVGDAKAQQPAKPGAPTNLPGVQPGPAQPLAALPSAEPPEAATLLSKDPTLLTQAEIDLLQQLADRREQIESRARELDLREGLLKAAEDRIGKKIQEMKALQVTINGLIKKHDAQQDAKLNSLVKIYQNMKPKDAARIFEELELDTLLMVAERMKERKLAAIMAKMDPKKAREVTIELARLRKLPSPATGLPNS